MCTQSGSSALAVQCSSFMVLTASPVLATFLSDNTCFRYFITGQPPVLSTFQTSLYECHLLCSSLGCQTVCGSSHNKEITLSASVVPSWQYSYQCSSSLLVNYTPVLLYSYTITGLLIPVLQYLYCQLRGDVIEKYFPRALVAGYIKNTIYAYKPDEKIPSRRLFNGISIVSRAYMNNGVLLTFGMASPLLAVAVSVDCISCFLVFLERFNRALSIRLRAYVSGRRMFGETREVYGCSNCSSRGV
jgi:hypothetical protein